MQYNFIFWYKTKKLHHRVLCITVEWIKLKNNNSINDFFDTIISIYIVNRYGAVDILLRNRVTSVGTVEQVFALSAAQDTNSRISMVLPLKSPQTFPRQ